MKRYWYTSHKKERTSPLPEKTVKGARPCSGESPSERNHKYRQLIEINSFITNSLEKKEVLKRILNQVKCILQCEASSLLLADRELKVLKFAVMSEEGEKEILKNTGLKMGEGIAGTVYSNGMPLIINNPSDDPRFSDIADKQAKKQTRSLIAVPLAVDGEIIGVIESINKRGGSFTPFDLTILQYISTQAAIAIKNADLFNMAIRDNMTMLYVHKYFKERLIEEGARSKRYGHPLSLVMLDIDHFKSFNDTYGHQAGDKVLKAVADTIARNCRNMDIPCRYGGEEFAVILPETGTDDALVFSERVREEIEAMFIPWGDHELHLTISAGVASLPAADTPTMDDFIRMTDMALYYSKNAGRNRSTLYTPGLDTPE